MAEGRARSLDHAQVRSERRVQLRVVARSDEPVDGHQPVPLSAPSMPPPLLSQTSDIYGIGRGGWLAAGALYAALAAAFLLIGWHVTPPEPWPAKEAVFRVVFENPAPSAPAPPPAPEPPQNAALEALPAAIPEPEPVPPPLAKPAPAPRLVEPEAMPVELPKPPPPKPVLKPRSAAVAPARPAATAEPRVAALPPPSVAAPVLPPQPISGLASNRKPDYPAQARQRGQQGRVVLRVEVSAAGAPLNIAVVASSGHAVLDQAALRAVEQWRFKPATQAGTPVPGVVDVPFQFRLED